MCSTTSVMYCLESQEDINNGVYASTNDTALEDLKLI